ncbi:hypothetical protein, partial [Lactobacillus intestinalis]
MKTLKRTCYGFANQ